VNLNGENLASNGHNLKGQAQVAGADLQDNSNKFKKDDFISLTSGKKLGNEENTPDQSSIEQLIKNAILPSDGRHVWYGCKDSHTDASNRDHDQAGFE